jgi:hypothetical protein
LTLHLDPAVTVLLRANDHGKTNILDAITHLNAGTTFDSERDLNWDHASDPANFPFLRFEFSLDEDDRKTLLEVSVEIERAKAASAPPATSPTPPAPAADPSSTAADPVTTALPSETLTLDRMPSTLVCITKGVSGELYCTRAADLPDGAMTTFLKRTDLA